MSLIEDQNSIWADARSVDAILLDPTFNVFKRAVDIFGALVLLAIAAMIAPVLYVINMFYDRGALIYRAERMGQDCAPFTAFKFRSMMEASHSVRGANDPLEVGRITPIGKLIRKFRIDELPQAVNVLKGEMSLVGPRPDDYAQAIGYIDSVPGYRARHSVRPGITGLAQVESGYAVSVNETSTKVQFDLAYIRNMGIWAELKIMVKTLGIIFSGAGK